MVLQTYYFDTVWRIARIAKCMPEIDVSAVVQGDIEREVVDLRCSSLTRAPSRLRCAGITGKGLWEGEWSDAETRIVSAA